jgi:hypothetical protein
MSGVTRDRHAPFCEGRRVKPPPATRRRAGETPSVNLRLVGWREGAVAVGGVDVFVVGDAEA